ncbi:uncharacterized protein HMPREF1541_02528 [Cyphellophora europaea CBS 101466]|uniref:Uncharacterized protein n=1 Tax=Cyphellophora europaea (strain CBS 101466) TaxID=1220924 RepID=W2S632_CYPE1|nr:uncharacterized protein HMPREF1541_02528 [Cyphellophora europaea CBS 101466]ETN43369.1 hypothetical protein HMPREF1541_02528 [Cyphellophora europaea CBS 101466]
MASASSAEPMSWTPIDLTDKHDEFPHPAAKRAQVQPTGTDFSKSPLRCMYECQRKGWTGQCIRTLAEENKCINRMFSGSESVGPDKGLSCTMYMNSGCKGDSEDGFRYPGWDKDWSVDPWRGVFKSAPKSWKCKFE